MYFPVDNEFVTLYVVYILMFLFILIGVIIGKRRRYFTINAIVYGVYLVFMLNAFSDKNNFGGGSSLIVLFYGGLFWLIHVIVLIGFEWILFFKRQFR